MTLYRYFKRALPTAEETGLSENATKGANEAVSAVLMGPSEATVSRKRSYLAFTDEQRATIGRYAAITSAFDYIKSHPSIIISGFVKAGITNSDHSCNTDTAAIADSDPFDSDFEDNCWFYCTNYVYFWNVFSIAQLKFAHNMQMSDFGQIAQF